MAIKLHEARQFFRGYAPHLAYEQFITGVHVLPTDITPYELQIYKAMTRFLEMCKEHGIHLPYWDVSNPPPQHLVVLAADMPLRWAAPDSRHNDGRVVSP